MASTDGVAADFISPSLEIDRHDLAMMLFLDLRTDTLIELLAMLQGLFASQGKACHVNY